MKIELTLEDYDALTTGYAQFDGYSLDNEEENKVFKKQQKRYKKILNKLEKHFFNKETT